MKQLRLFVLLASIAALLFASSFAQGDKEAIRSLSQRWADLYDEGDIEGLAELYTENAVLYGNTGQVLEGKEAIQEALQQAHDAAPGDMSRQATDEVGVFDDTAYDIGSYTVTGEGGQIISRGNYLTILRRVAGDWRIYRQIDNIDTRMLQQLGAVTVPGEGADVEEELAWLEHEWTRAYVERDLELFERILADDWTFTGPDGSVHGKEREIADVRSGDLMYTSGSAHDVEVRVYGDAAVAIGRYVMEGTYRGEDISGQYRFTDTWIRRGGEWQAVATQITRIERE